MRPPTRRGTIESYVVSKNLHRRHLNESQRSMIAARFSNIKNGEVGGTRKKAATQISVADAAALLHVGTTTVTSAREVLKNATYEEIAAIESGEAAVSTIAKQIRAKESPIDLPAHLNLGSLLGKDRDGS